MSVEAEQAVKLRDLLAAADMHIYRRTESEDILLLRWWIHLRETGDFDKFFPTPPRTIHDFFATFQLPHVLLYTTLTTSHAPHPVIDFAFKFSPFQRGAFISLWSHRRSRVSPLLPKRLITACEFGFSAYTVFVAVTQLDNVSGILLKSGCKVLGKIPYLLASGDYTFYYLTHEQFRKSELFAKGAPKNG